MTLGPWSSRTVWFMVSKLNVSVKLVIKGYTPNKFSNFRIFMGSKLIGLASYILPLDTKFELIENPYLYTCPKCHRSFYAEMPRVTKSVVTCCPKCSYQRLIGYSSGIIEELEPTCGYDCHWDNKLGFIPEEGCPYHDF